MKKTRKGLIYFLYNKTMPKPNPTYIAIDLKSFYASVECIERGLDPLTTNLVVADATRTNKTICLAVSPALKSYGISGRARLFEVEQKIAEINRKRKNKVEYIIAAPRMAYYIQYSTKIYEIYLKYVAPEDIHVYSIDEVFIDITSYLKTYKTTAHELAIKMIRDVLKNTGITATAGVGTNLYLAKIAMDIVAKHMPPDQDGVRIAELDEMSYRKLLWNHQPITDFWRIGPGYAKRLAKHNLHTMGDIAKASLDFSDKLYKEFGINAELLIDHAWGYESCTMSDIKSYRSDANSISNGQVLSRPYSPKEAETIIREMVDNLALNLVEQSLTTNHIHLSVGYDPKSSLQKYTGEIKSDRYKRKVAKPINKSITLSKHTSSTKIITKSVLETYRAHVNPDLMIHYVSISAENLHFRHTKEIQQYDLFTDIQAEEKQDESELKMQKAIINIKKRYGKNAILKGINFEKESTGRQRNQQIGGHKG